MKLKFFAIPATGGEPAEAELNRFLGSHRVAGIERHLIADGAASFWAVCVTWIEAEGGAAEAGKRGRVDYRELLAADEFALYDRLRRLRKQLADSEGLPPFAVFTNEQLAEMVRRRVTSLKDLAAIDGIGESRLNRYGEAFLEVLCDGVPRLIHAAPFADRVAHHALMRLLAPRLEQALVPTSFACRPGLGVHAALAHAQFCARRWPWYLKLDVRHYFPSIPHDRLLALVAFCNETLGLALKPPILRPVGAGLGLCGMRVYPGTIKLGHRRRRSWTQRRRYWEARWRCGDVGAATSASVLPERIPLVVGKPSRGTGPRCFRARGANRKGAGALVGSDRSRAPNARRRPPFDRRHCALRPLLPRAPALRRPSVGWVDGRRPNTRRRGGLRCSDQPTGGGFVAARSSGAFARIGRVRVDAGLGSLVVVWGPAA